MADHPLDGKRVAYLLELSRRRTPEEITNGVMALAGSFSAEMWRALELLRLERSPGTQPLPENVPSIADTVPTVWIDDDV